MLPFLTGDFANPSGAHAESRRARVALDDARDRIAELVGVGPGELVLTSGGTEADDLAVHGGWEAVADGSTDPAPPAVVCAAMEHHAVLRACRALARRTGAELREVPSGATAGSISIPWPTPAAGTWAWCRSWRSTMRSARSSLSTR